MPLYALDGRAPNIDPEAFVHPDATVIGAVTIGPGSSVWPQAVLRGDNLEITIGARTSIQDGAVIHSTLDLPTVIGDDCTIGHLAHIEGATIEDRALVGSGSIVLHRAIVRTDAIVGAAALVPNGMEVPSRAMALGVPAKLRLDAVSDDAVAANAENAAKYVRNAQRHRLGTVRLPD